MLKYPQSLRIRDQRSRYVIAALRNNERFRDLYVPTLQNTTLKFESTKVKIMEYVQFMNGLCQAPCHNVSFDPFDMKTQLLVVV